MRSVLQGVSRQERAEQVARGMASFAEMRDLLLDLDPLDTAHIKRVNAAEKVRATSAIEKVRATSAVVQ
jgi:hypothetical protein